MGPGRSRASGLTLTLATTLNTGITMIKYILLFIFTVNLFCQENSDIKLIGHLGESNGDCRAVEAKGDTVYFVEGRGFKIVDYSDKEEPILIGQCILPNKNITSIIIENNYAYLLSVLNLMIVDISNIAQPFFVTQYEIYAGNNIAAKDNLLYLVYGYCYEDDCQGGCLILDISDINSINERYNYITNHPIFDIAIKDTTAYLSVEDSIIILNIANPDLPKKVTQLANGAYSSSLYIDNNILYAVYPFSGISVFNIDDPYQLNSIGNLDISGVKANLHNNYLFISQRIIGDGPDDSKVAIVDVTSPDTPVKISEINMGDFGFANNLDYSNNYLYVSHGSSGLYIVDVSNVNNPVEVTRYKTGYKYDLAVHNNYVYLVSGYDGIQIIDITDKALPELIGNIDLKEHPADRTKKAIIENNILYIMIERYSNNFVNSIYMFDISDPREPKILGKFNTNLMIDIAVNNKIIYLTGIYDFSIVDVRDPEYPVFLKTFSKGTGAGKDLIISSGYAFIGEWKEGLRIIDITDLMNLYEAGIYNDFCVGDIYINENIAYVIAQSHLEPEYSLRILDISNLSSIKEMGYTGLNSYVKSIAYKNGKIVLGDGLKIIDVSNPVNPKVIDSTDVCGDLNKIILDDKFIFAADGINGLYIFQYDGFINSIDQDNIKRYSFKLYQNYPNPFNSSTFINYTLPESGFVQLIIFNILGQQVSILVEKEQPKGNYRIALDASSFVSGLYFCRLKTESYSETKKLILMK